jgi:hypothetical protein
MVVAAQQLSWSLGKCRLTQAFRELLTILAHGDPVAATSGAGWRDGEDEAG